MAYEEMDDIAFLSYARRQKNAAEAQAQQVAKNLFNRWGEKLYYDSCEQTKNILRGKQFERSQAEAIARHFFEQHHHNLVNGQPVAFAYDDIALEVSIKPDACHIVILDESFEYDNINTLKDALTGLEAAIKDSYPEENIRYELHSNNIKSMLKLAEKCAQNGIQIDDFRFQMANGDEVKFNNLESLKSFSEEYLAKMQKSKVSEGVQKPKKR